MQLIFGYLNNQCLTKETYIQKLIDTRNIANAGVLNTSNQTLCEQQILYYMLHDINPDFEKLADEYGSDIVDNALDNLGATILTDFLK